MKIELEKDLFLTNDGTQFILKRVFHYKKDLEKPIGYYADLEHALKGYIRHKTVNSNANTIKQLINEIHALKQHITILFAKEGIDIE